MIIACWREIERVWEGQDVHTQIVARKVTEPVWDFGNSELRSGA